jgi:hypothetical protein
MSRVARDKRRSDRAFTGGAQAFAADLDAAGIVPGGMVLIARLRYANA